MIANFTHIIKNYRTRGFTLIETLVAVMILATAVAGPLSIASRSLTNSLVAKDQVSAYFLAQDAVEYVRFVRDSNSLKGADWITGAGGSTAGTDLSPCLTTVNANGCYFDSTIRSYTDRNGNNPSVPVTCGAGCIALAYDNTNSRFTYENTTSAISLTLFTRQVQLTSISSTEYTLKVTVSWKDVGNVSRQVVINENIFQWE